MGWLNLADRFCHGARVYLLEPVLPDVDIDRVCDSRCLRKQRSTVPSLKRSFLEIHHRSLAIGGKIAPTELVRRTGKIT